MSTVDAKKRAAVEANFRALLRNYKLRARKLELPFSLTPERFRELTKDPCYICGKKPSNTHIHDRSKPSYKRGPYTYNGLDRFDSRKGYIEGNVISCCWICNRAKGDLSIEKFLLYIHRAYNHIIKPALQEGVPDET